MVKSDVPQIIYDSPLLQVTFDSVPGAQTTWVTFGSADMSGPFGRAFVRSRGEQGIYFDPKRMDWYQHRDIWQAVGEAVKYTIGRTITYGSSMGGFGALVFADMLSADLVIAAVPQCSVFPSIVGSFDRRFADFAVGLEPQRPDAREGLSSEIRVAFIYDPLNREDRRNIKLIAGGLRCDALDVPAWGAWRAAYAESHGPAAVPNLSDCRW